MKVLLTLFVLFFSYPVMANCYDCESEAYNAYKDAKRAYRSSDLDSCQNYARKAYRHASYTEDYARYCD